MTEPLEMNEPVHIALVLVIMLVCGVLGGLVNFWGEDLPREERHPFLKRLSAGVAAALVVPLFLNMISSSLLKDSRSAPLSLFIFAGFCIIAAISSKAFIDSITKRILDKVQKVAGDQKRLANEVDPIVAAQTEVGVTKGAVEAKAGVNEEEAEEEEEQDTEGVSQEGSLTPSSKPTEKREGAFTLNAVGTDADTKKVILALGTDKYTWRSLDGITADTLLPSNIIYRALKWLEKNGFAVRRTGQKGPLWALTAEGRTTFAQSLASKDN